jgi:multidrug resistance efflux pump
LSALLSFQLFPVSPGVPLVTLIDLNDVWIHFDLREDLVRMLKVGDRFNVRIPALADRPITVVRQAGDSGDDQADNDRRDAG